MLLAAGGAEGGESCELGEGGVHGNGAGVEFGGRRVFVGELGGAGDDGWRAVRGVVGDEAAVVEFGGFKFGGGGDFVFGDARLVLWRAGFDAEVVAAAVVVASAVLVCEFWREQFLADIRTLGDWSADGNRTSTSQFVLAPAAKKEKR